MNLDYYIEQSRYSDPGAFSYLYEALPSSLASLIDAVNNLFVHAADSVIFIGNGLLPCYSELDARYISRTLSLLQHKKTMSLLHTRDSYNRVLGVCRDYALMLCSFLRSKGIPARLRSGFNTYYSSAYYRDGFCLEFYDQSQKKWRLVDCRTTPEVIDRYGLVVDFDLTDLTKAQFISAANAWLLCRSGKMHANQFGCVYYFGMPYIRTKLIQDFLLLSKEELLIWDLWGSLLKKADIPDAEVDCYAQYIIEHENHFDPVHAQLFTNKQFVLPEKVLVANPFLNERWEFLQ